MSTLRDVDSLQSWNHPFNAVMRFGPSNKDRIAHVPFDIVTRSGASNQNWMAHISTLVNQVQNTKLKRGLANLDLIVWIKDCVIT